MDKQDVVDQVEVFEEHRAHQTVEIAAGNEAEFSRSCRHWHTFHHRIEDPAGMAGDQAEHPHTLQCF